MKKLKYILAVGVTALLMASCSLSKPVLVTDNPAGEEKGIAEYSVILGIFRPMKADISIKKAAENGGITKVATVDVRVESSFFKTTYKTVVTGQ